MVKQVNEFRIVKMLNGKSYKGIIERVVKKIEVEKATLRGRFRCLGDLSLHGSYIGDVRTTAGAPRQGRSL
mgnify:CR=1 FL=1